MDQMLQKVVVYWRISILDGFSGYNQVKVDPEDVLKKTFTTLWGTFASEKVAYEGVGDSK